MTIANSNAAFYTVICASLTIGGFLVAAQGCDLQSMVSVDVPPPVLEAVAPDDLEGGITLDEAERVWEDWTSYVQGNTERLRAAIDDANDRYYALASLIDTGVSILGEHSGAFPFGSIVMTGLGVLTGLFLKRPQEDARVAKEKEASYNAGLVRGAEVAKPMVEITKTEIDA